MRMIRMFIYVSLFWLLFNKLGADGFDLRKPLELLKPYLPAITKLIGNTSTSELQNLVDGNLTNLVQSQPSNILQANTQSANEKSIEYVNVSLLLGKSDSEIVNLYGEPIDKNKSAYDYTWWDYSDENNILQIGIEKGKVVTVFESGAKFSIQPLTFLGKYNEIFKNADVNSKVSVNVGQNHYMFEMTGDDTIQRPVIKIGSNWAQLYMDSVTKKLYAVRYMTAKTFVKIKPYAVKYSGELIKSKSISNSEWELVEKGDEKAIVTMSNFLRKNFRIVPLKQSKELQKIARSHSTDMFDNNYFAHNSPTQGDLKERLKTSGLEYRYAGENIASNYIDGFDVVFGWLNSPSHRDNLLDGTFNSIGAGVDHKFFTQEFASE